jgi:hypothetical protein
MSFALPIVDELTSARSKLENGGPLNARTLRAVEALRGGSAQERVIDGAIAYLASLVVTGQGRQQVRFCEVTTPEDWRRVRELRLRCYKVSLPYLLDVLEPDGSDRHDRHSFVYAAFLGDVAVATIRATAYPYETLDHMQEADLAGFLGRGWKTDYIEWGRLLVDSTYAKMRLTPALITYAGLRLLTLTPYRSYFGYTKPNVRELVSRFPIDSATMRFKIPARGDHDYLMTKGTLTTSAVREIPRWLRRMSNKMAARPAEMPSTRALAF